MTETRKVSFILGLGICFVPLLFGWFIFRKGYSNLARGVTIACMLFGVLVYNNLPEKTVQTADQIAMQIKIEAKDKAREEAKSAYNIGDQIELGKFRYTITDAGARKQIGKGFTKVRPSQGATFAVFQYRIENIGNETATVMTSDFELVDAKGRKFRSSSKAQTALAMSGNSDYILSELQPGLSTSGIVAFEVPFDAVVAKTTLVIPEKGLFGVGKANVTVPAL